MLWFQYVLQMPRIRNSLSPETALGNRTLRKNLHHESSAHMYRSMLLHDEPTAMTSLI